jgi:hypothetical protein
MNPEQVLDEPRDRYALERVMRAFAAKKPTAEERHAALVNAGLEWLNVQAGSTIASFGTQLAAQLIARPVPPRNAETHALPLLLNYLLADPEQNVTSDDDDVKFLTSLLARFLDRSRAVAARQSVGKIEDAGTAGFGTGILVDQGLLTCNHILTKSTHDRAWVRFGYKINFDCRSRSQGERFELDIAQPMKRGGGMLPDFIVLRIVEMDAKRPRWPLAKVPINAGQKIRMIHHPGGRPAEVSEPGRLLHVDSAYFLHDIPADDGSSGAPIFSETWDLVGLHRGGSPNVKGPGTAEAVPVNALLDLLGD